MLAVCFFNRHFTQARIDYLADDSPTVFHVLMQFVRFALFMGVLGLSLFWPRQAMAAFLFCNETKSVIEAAFGHRDDGVWTSEGWWQIQPGQCARVYGKPLTQRFYFFYARALTLKAKDGAGPMIWSGKYAFCADNKAFKAQGDSNCEARGFQMKGFQEVDVGVHQKDYTLTFQDPSAQ